MLGQSLGLFDGDCVEKCWAHLRRFGPRLKYVGPRQWMDALNDLVRDP